MIIKFTAIAITVWLNITPAIVCTGIRLWCAKRKLEYMNAKVALLTAKKACVERRLAHLQ